MQRAATALRWNLPSWSAACSRCSSSTAVALSTAPSKPRRQRCSSACHSSAGAGTIGGASAAAAAAFAGAALHPSSARYISSSSLRAQSPHSNSSADAAEESITSTSNAYVKHCVKLREKARYRREQGRLLLVGSTIVQELAGERAVGSVGKNTMLMHAGRWDGCRLSMPRKGSSLLSAPSTTDPYITTCQPPRLRHALARRLLAAPARRPLPAAPRTASRQDSPDHRGGRPEDLRTGDGVAR